MSLENDFQKLIERLRISDVYLKKTTSEFLDDYNPKYVDLSEFSTEVKFFTRDAKVVETNEAQRILQVIVEAGHRFVVGQQPESKVVAFVEADFVAEYLLEEDMDSNFISKFSEQFVAIHVWPFWREFLLSQSIRLKLPAAILPLS